MNSPYRWCCWFLLCSCLFFAGFSAKAADSISAATSFQPATNAAAPAISNGDNAWLLASSALVLMMTAPGLILFYGGLGGCEKNPGGVLDRFFFFVFLFMF